MGLADAHTLYFGPHFNFQSGFLILKGSSIFFATIYAPLHLEHFWICPGCNKLDKNQDHARYTDAGKFPPCSRGGIMHEQELKMFCSYHLRFLRKMK